jgi:cardiolipin synthase
MSIVMEHGLTMVGFALCAVLILRLFRDQRAPSVTVAWLLAIILIPYLGVPAYLLFGGRKIRRMAKQKTLLYDRQEPTPLDDDSPCSTIQRVLLTAGMPPAREGNRVDLIPHGNAGFNTMVSLIEDAQEYIHLNTFILGRDATGRAIVELLARKAAEGVRVRLLLDALGCLWTNGRFVEPIRAAGGEVGVFMPMLPLRRKWSANLRNHRKIMVIDGQKAMVGGMNVAEQYMGPGDNPKRWLDTAAVISGPAVTDLDAIFTSDWNFATDTENEYPQQQAEAIADGTLAQIAASGPDTPGDAIYDAVFTAIMEAKRRIWITTPYFIPDEPLMKALLLQTRLGRDVRIFVPRRSNHLLADLARGRFLRELIQHGAKVFVFEKMVHAKLMLFDEHTAVIGSANIDSRSFYLNYEVQLLAYGPRETAAVAQWIEAAGTDSSRLELGPVSLLRGWAEDMAALVAPLL